MELLKVKVDLNKKKTKSKKKTKIHNVTWIVSESVIQ